MYISNYLSLISTMELLVIVPIFRPVDVISDEGYLINVYILFVMYPFQYFVEVCLQRRFRML